MRDSHSLSNDRVSSHDSFRSRISLELNAISRRYGPAALRVSIGIVMVWFGVLKFFPNASPAEDIAVQTLSALTFGSLAGRTLLLGLAVFETLLGACFLAGLFPRIALPLLLVHMLGTALPFVLFPEQLFSHHLLVPTFLGQYIVKNIIIVSAAIVLKRQWR